MTAYIRYRGRIYRAHLRSAKFSGGELFVTARIDSSEFKVEKCVHWSAVIGYDVAQNVKAA